MNFQTFRALRAKETMGKNNFFSDIREAHHFCLALYFEKVFVDLMRFRKHLPKFL